MQVQGNLEQVLGAGRNRRQHRRQPAETAAQAAAPANGSSILADLLLKATDKRNQDLDAGVLRRIKALCKRSDEHIRAVHDYLLHALEANHAQVRLHAMEVCDQLFHRSHLFRHLTTQHLPQILEHAVGTKASRPLPGPPNVAAKLHETALESIDQWADKYGAYYQQLRVSMRYLRDVLQMRFPQLRARSAAAEAAARAREARAQEILREKLARIVETYNDTSTEIQSTLKQMDEAFELLMAKPDQAQRHKESLPAEDEEGLEWEEVAAEDTAEGEIADDDDVEGLSEYRDVAPPEDLLGSTSVLQNPDAAVLETLKELNQLLGGSHMRTVNEWLRILTQVLTGESGSDEDRERDQLLRRATELRGSITHAQDRYGAIMDVFKTNEDITLGTLPAPQVAGSSGAAAEQDPKEAMPPWLTRKQPGMADLFGPSSSDDEQTPEMAAKADTSKPKQIASGAGLQAPSLHDNGRFNDSSRAEKGVPKQVRNSAAAAKAAADADLRSSALKQESPVPTVALGKLREGAQVSVTSTEVLPEQHKPRLDYSVVAKRLRGEASGSAGLNRRPSANRAAPGKRASSGSVRAVPDRVDAKEGMKRKAGSIMGQAAAKTSASVPEGNTAPKKLSVKPRQPPNLGSKGRDPWKAATLDDAASDDKGDTPKLGNGRKDPWAAAASDDDASMASGDASSAASEGVSHNGTAAQRGAGRRQNRKRKASHAGVGAKPEPKKASIPDSLKQALAVQAPLVPSGPHLAYWDSKDETLVNARGMQVYNHWGPVDEHKTLPAERLNELFGSMATYYKPPSKEELAAAKQRIEPEKPSFKDEPLETQKFKRPKVPVTPILPPGSAKLTATSASMSAIPVKTEAEPLLVSGPAASEPAQASLAEERMQRSAHQWPSQTSVQDFDRVKIEAGDSAHGKAAAEQEIEVEEVEWKPEEASAAPSGSALIAKPNQVQPSKGPTAAASQTRRILDPERPSKGQRAMDKAYNDAVLAEAATKDPILAHRWAAQQASKAEKTKKAQGAKKMGVKASLAKKLLSKRATKRAAYDLSAQESEAHAELNTNRWEEK